MSRLSCFNGRDFLSVVSVYLLNASLSLVYFYTRQYEMAQANIVNPLRTLISISRRPVLCLQVRNI